MSLGFWVSSSKHAKPTCTTSRISCKRHDWLCSSQVWRRYCLQQHRNCHAAKTTLKPNRSPSPTSPWLTPMPALSSCARLGSPLSGPAIPTRCTALPHTQAPSSARYDSACTCFTQVHFGDLLGATRGSFVSRAAFHRPTSRHVQLMSR